MSALLEMQMLLRTYCGDQGREKGGLGGRKGKRLKHLDRGKSR